MNLLKEKIKEIEKTGLTKKVSYSNESEILSVYKIPLSFLYYNDENGRINTVYNEYIAENSKIKPKIGNSKYNEIFEEFIYKSDSKSLENTKQSISKRGQDEPGVVLKDGRVIDGNRRFTALRKLQRETGRTFYFEAVILNLDIQKRFEEKKIKSLELDLQLAREERKDYDPIDRIFDVYITIKVKKLLTINDYKIASGAGNTKGIKRDLRLADLIIRFLDIVSPGGKPEEKFYLARELKLDGPIEELEGTINSMKDRNIESIKDSVLTTLAVQIASSTIGNGDITRKIRSLKKHILKNDNVKKYYVDATDDKVDNIIDYFNNNPIKNVQDLKSGLESNEKASKASNELISSTNRLVRKGKIETERRNSLDTLEYIYDLLGEMHSNDFKELKREEYSQVKDTLHKIKDVCYKLEKGEI